MSCIGLWLDAGSMYETAENNGTAHFLEHMAFKGTHSRSQKELEREVESMGAKLGAYTSRDHTVYHASVLPSGIPQALTILADIIQNPILGKDQIEFERQVILREMEEVNGQPEEVVMDWVHSVAFKGSTMERTILGTKENVLSIKQSDLSNYIKQHYCPNRMVVACAGPVEHSEIVDLSSSLFKNLVSSNTLPDHPSAAFQKSGGTICGEPPVVMDTNPLASIADDPTIQSALAMPGPSMNDPDFFVYSVLSNVIGSGDRSTPAEILSPLPKLLCHSNKILDAMNTFMSCYSNTGLFGVSMALARSKLREVLPIIIREFHKLGSGKPIPQEEVNIAARNAAMHAMLSLSTSWQVCEDIGRQLLSKGHRLTPAEVWSKHMSVSPQDIQRVMSIRAMPVVAAVGPKVSLPDIKSLCT
ncbi:mitochondrial processing peptidase subunit beta [Pelomyxa schiedti]|nr:mitochondrial processing peptidase subunit beta [Pelomyxa schiedti]